ncbi:MAG: CoA transferase subunit A [Acidimicrobiia bacterium]|nr:CoA transferase subunit A [bacterium]MDE0643614.1 CoA transferase subunit A [bacterium]MXX65181.1 CoA transferase subunit A [Acidimicrobiia bacterium]MYH56342.1 CoA transferase subunit A [Acidimicrobiia bacterium]
MGIHLGSDKPSDLQTAVAMIPPGSMVALGGGLSARLPMALVREVIRAGIGDLHVVGSAHSIDVDMLAAAGLISVCEESYVGYEQDLGLAPAFRRAAQKGDLEARESCCDTILTQLRAAEMGLSFLPVHGVKGTDIEPLHPEYGRITCPFTDHEYVVVPPLSPDVALIHAPIGDRQGNLHIEQPYVLDERFAVASAQVIATVDRIVSTREVVEAGIVIPFYRVSALVEVPFGAHPTSCYPGYAYDRNHLSAWVTAAGTPEGAGDYLRNYVTGVDEAGYRRRIGPERLEHLTGYQASEETWMEIFR